ncbi:hypothetical protein CGRA01v4_08131 [Colletotrichum graminicola]|nr:hypothetical protein CGRA01v4_08131 [Colletotrichum graminicola]
MGFTMGPSTTPRTRHALTRNPSDATGISLYSSTRRTQGSGASTVTLLGTLALDFTSTFWSSPKPSGKARSLTTQGRFAGLGIITGN